MRDVLEITRETGEIAEPKWLLRAEMLHRQLRPQLPVGAEYLARLQSIFVNGARMTLIVEDDEVCALALWRIIENTYEGRRLYVDDLVTDEALRSQGMGKMLLGWLKIYAEKQGCDVLALDSGVQRGAAHRFYFREGMIISSFCFRKNLK